MDGPILSVLVGIVGDTTGPPDTNQLEPCRAAPAQGPKVIFKEVSDLQMYRHAGRSREHHDEIRGRVPFARGEIVVPTEDRGIPALDRALNWAVYFCDFLRFQNPLTPEESSLASDANVSYKRSALQAIQPVWQEAFREVAVNRALRARGETVVPAPDVVLSQNRLGLRFGSAIQERFIWGRSCWCAGTRAQLSRPFRRIFWAVFAPALTVLIFVRLIRVALAKRRTLGPFIKLSRSWGKIVGYVTSRAVS